MSTLRHSFAGVFEPLTQPARYKGAHGGRGSGKSHFFAGLLVDEAQGFPGDNGGVGMRAVCIREVQKSLKQSAKKLIEDKIMRLGATGFKVWKDRIETPGDGVIIFEGMQDHTADSIKSLEGFDRAWGEEAQSLSAFSMELLRPTIRAPGSELWFSWNPRRPTDSIDQLLRGLNLPTGARVVQANWSDNPWLPDELEQERLDCLANDPERYNHIWEGGYARVYEGAYFADLLEKARLEGRIGQLARDSLNQVRAYWDIGSSSSKADATSIWVVQFIGKEIRVLDYYEAIGQPFDAHVHWLRENGYVDAVQVLPHDGRKHDVVHAVTPESYLRSAGLSVRVARNAGTGAAMKRIEAVRRVLPSCWFNEAATEGGRDALGWYHERRDEHRQIGLGPEHDWSSHSADAFGAMAMDFLDLGGGSKRAPSPRRNVQGFA